MNARRFSVTYSQIDSARRNGFTLIEVMVAVALVVLIMLIFAQVFEVAGSSVSRMRGIAENDQRARILQNIIKADFDKRTVRWVYPFAANEDLGAPGAQSGSRSGYFYVSENNPYNQADDVVQFTVTSTMTQRNSDQTPYYGQARNLASLIYANQPDADDGQVVVNNTGLSTVAEISYFVRNGNLYRRQLLVREPLSVVTTSAQPTDSTAQRPTGVDVFDPNLTPAFHYPYTDPFWRDFDYSAYFDSSRGAVFLGSNSLSNSASGIDALANPANRFGFSPPSATRRGVPKEFADSSVNALFIGRFTLEECSHQNFRYPQARAESPPSNFFIPTDPSVSLSMTSDRQVVSDFVGGTRRGEDLLMANVHAFDVQLWDERGQLFVNIGDPYLATLSSGSDYGPQNRYSTAQGILPSPYYGPRATDNGNLTSASLAVNPPYAINAVYDTWHPAISLTTTNDPITSPDSSTGQTNYDDPPLRPVRLMPSSVTGNAADIDSWAPATKYNTGDIVFPSGPAGTFHPTPTYPPLTKRKLPYGEPFYYRCVQAGLSASTTNSLYPPNPPYPSTPPPTLNPAAATDMLLEPAWPQIDGLTIADNGVIWQAVDNRKALKAVKISIRYRDSSTQQMRQLTLIQSLVD